MAIFRAGRSFTTVASPKIPRHPPVTLLSVRDACRTWMLSLVRNGPRLTRLQIEDSVNASLVRLGAMDITPDGRKTVGINIKLRKLIFKEWKRRYKQATEGSLHLSKKSKFSVSWGGVCFFTLAGSKAYNIFTSGSQQKQTSILAQGISKLGDSQNNLLKEIKKLSKKDDEPDPDKPDKEPKDADQEKIEIKNADQERIEIKNMLTALWEKVDKLDGGAATSVAFVLIAAFLIFRG